MNYQPFHEQCSDSVRWFACKRISLSRIQVWNWEVPQITPTFTWTSHFRWVWFCRNQFTTKLLFLPLLSGMMEQQRRRKHTFRQNSSNNVLSWRWINDVLMLITLVTLYELQMLPLGFLWLGSYWRCAEDPGNLLLKQSHILSPAAWLYFSFLSIPERKEKRIILDLFTSELHMRWTSHIE